MCWVGACLWGELRLAWLCTRLFSVVQNTQPWVRSILQGARSCGTVLAAHSDGRWGGRAAFPWLLGKLSKLFYHSLCLLRAVTDAVACNQTWLHPVPNRCRWRYPSPQISVADQKGFSRGKLALRGGQNGGQLTRSPSPLRKGNKQYSWIFLVFCSLLHFQESQIAPLTPISCMPVCSLHLSKDLTCTELQSGRGSTCSGYIYCAHLA